MTSIMLIGGRNSGKFVKVTETGAQISFAIERGEPERYVLRKRRVVHEDEYFVLDGMTDDAIEDEYVRILRARRPSDRAEVIPCPRGFS